MDEITVRREVLVRVQTNGRYWRLGTLRSLLEKDAIAELPDDWMLVIQRDAVEDSHAVRFMEPDGDIAASSERVLTPWALNTPIEDLGLSVRTYNLLKRENLDTIGHCIEKSPNDLFDYRNFGSRSVDELAEKLAQCGYELRPDLPDEDSHPDNGTDLPSEDDV